jgi:hypothetical protein
VTLVVVAVLDLLLLQITADRLPTWQQLKLYEKSFPALELDCGTGETVRKYLVEDDYPDFTLDGELHKGCYALGDDDDWTVLCIWSTGDGADRVQHRRLIKNSQSYKCNYLK